MCARDVRPSARGNHSPEPSREEICKARIPAKQNHTCFPDARVETTICSSLIVDDFGIKYVRKEHVEHMLTVLQTDYKVAVDRKAENYASIFLGWDYENQKVHLSMPGPGYFKEALVLVRFGHRTQVQQNKGPTA